MFEIYGILSENDINRADRLCANLDYALYASPHILSHPKVFDGCIYNFCNSYSDFEGNICMLREEDRKKIIIIPPFYEAARLYSPLCDKMIVAFPESRARIAGPYVTPVQLEKALNDFERLKDKTIIMLSGFCRDYILNTYQLKLITGNQAAMKCAVKEAVYFTDEYSGCVYFTYLDEGGNAHIVYTESTYSLSVRHNMIKNAGFSGICWEDVSVMTEGNWESLRAAYSASEKNTP